MGRGLVPLVVMVVVQFCFAGMNIITKLAMDSGMSPFVMVTYRQIFAALVLAPFAYFLEWRTLPKITKHIALQMFFCSILGATMNQAFYFIGLQHTTPTIACALNNLLPAITFVMALPFGMEKIGIRTVAGQAKVIGTIVCVSGAMIMSFYHGREIPIGQSSLHWSYAETVSAKSSGSSQSSFIGPLFVMASCVAWSGWFILQGKMSNTFKAPYTTTGLMCFLASFQCGVIALFFEHDPKAWSLTSDVRLIGALYNGVVGSALTFFLMSWCIERRGPLYTSAFSPLLLVVVAIFGWGLLGAKVDVGSAVGSVLIVAGLYSVLWGKDKDMDEDDIFMKDVAVKVDIEMPPVHLNGKVHNQQV